MGTEYNTYLGACPRITRNRVRPSVNRTREKGASRANRGYGPCGEDDDKGCTTRKYICRQRSAADTFRFFIPCLIISKRDIHVGDCNSVSPPLIVFFYITSPATPSGTRQRARTVVCVFLLLNSPSFLHSFPFLIADHLLEADSQKVTLAPEEPYKSGVFRANFLRTIVIP